MTHLAKPLCLSALWLGCLTSFAREYEVWHWNVLTDAARWMARLRNHPSVIMGACRTNRGATTLGKKGRIRTSSTHSIRRGQRSARAPQGPGRTTTSI